MSSIKKVFTLSLLASVSLQSLAMQTDKINDGVLKSLQKRMIYLVPAVLIPSTIRLFWKDPKSDATSRFDAAKLTDIEFAKNHPKEYLLNFWHFYDDEVIGWTFKDKELKAKFNDDGSTVLKHSKKRLPHGLGGYATALTVTHSKAVKPLAVVYGSYMAVKNGWLSDKFFKHFGLADDKKDDKALAPAVVPVINLTLDTRALTEQIAQNNQNNAQLTQAFTTAMNNLPAQFQTIINQVVEAKFQQLQNNNNGAENNQQQVENNNNNNNNNVENQLQNNNIIAPQQQPQQQNNNNNQQQ